MCTVSKRVLISSQAKCLYIEDLVLNKDPFWHFGSLLGPYLYFRVLIFTILVSFTLEVLIGSLYHKKWVLIGSLSQSLGVLFSFRNSDWGIGGA